MKNIYNNIKIVTLYLIVTALSVCNISCRETSPNVTNPAISISGTWESIFNDYWNAMNYSYVFWEEDPTDWDAIREEYWDKFVALDEMENDSDADVYVDTVISGNEYYYLTKTDTLSRKYFTDITADLIDQHYYFELKDKYTIVPSNTQIKTRDYYHSWNVDLIPCIYNLINQRDDVSNLIVTEYSGFVAFSAQLGDVAYLYFSSFALTEYYDSDDSNTSATLFDVMENFRDIIYDNTNLKGAILDLRNNGGGDAADLSFLFSEFLNKDESMPFLYNRHKSGIGRLDYSPLLLESFTGTSDSETFVFPIVSLFNINSASMSEITSLFIKQFNEKSLWIGERTCGAQGGITSDYTFAAGMIENSNIKIYTPSSKTYDMNMVCHEGVGLTPDIEVLENDAIEDMRNGVQDLALNKAVEYLNSL